MLPVGYLQNLSCKNQVYLHGNKKSFYQYSFAHDLALKQRLGQLRNGLLTVIGLLDDAEYNLRNYGDRSG